MKNFEKKHNNRLLRWPTLSSEGKISFLCTIKKTFISGHCVFIHTAFQNLGWISDDFACTSTGVHFTLLPLHYVFHSLQ